MFKRWFESSSNGNGAAGNPEHCNGPADQALALMELRECPRPSGRPDSASGERAGGAPSDDRADFERIYSSAEATPQQTSCGILKVVEMVNSPHLSGLSSDARRCAVLMALDMAGAEIEYLLQDAVVRQRALNDYEKEQQEKLRRFEAEKAEESRTLQADLERLTGEYMARLQANLDEVAREQDDFRAWQRRKQQQAHRIADAAALCVPEGLASRSDSLTVVLERACTARREAS
jgi:hypothetical protein